MYSSACTALLSPVTACVIGSSRSNGFMTASFHCSSRFEFMKGPVFQNGKLATYAKSPVPGCYFLEVLDGLVLVRPPIGKPLPDDALEKLASALFIADAKAAAVAIAEIEFGRVAVQVRL